MKLGGQYVNFPRLWQARTPYGWLSLQFLPQISWNGTGNLWAYRPRLRPASHADRSACRAHGLNLSRRNLDETPACLFSRLLPLLHAVGKVGQMDRAPPGAVSTCRYRQGPCGQGQRVGNNTPIQGLPPRSSSATNLRPTGSPTKNGSAAYPPWASACSITWGGWKRRRVRMARAFATRCR